MGHTWVEIEISNLERTRSRKVKALVDTGATLTVLPKKLAKELEIKEDGEDKVLTGAGEIKIELGRAWIKIREKEGPFNIWISDVIDKVLLGVVVLETLGFEIDPKTGTLREKPLRLY